MLGSLQERFLTNQPLRGYLVPDRIHMYQKLLSGESVDEHPSLYSDKSRWNALKMLQEKVHGAHGANGDLLLKENLEIGVRLRFLDIVVTLCTSLAVMATVLAGMWFATAAVFVTGLLTARGLQYLAFLYLDGAGEAAARRYLEEKVRWLQVRDDTGEELPDYFARQGYLDWADVAERSYG